jgi:Mn2+/Fe2+ NRAMP family transporter
MQVFIQYSRYVSILKWAALVLFAYFGTMLMVHIPWDQVAWGLLVPSVDTSKDFISIVVAILGTTISPYLFFWQSSQEAEDQREQPQRDPLVRSPEQAPNAFARIRIDTYIGMGFSNLVAIAIIITTAATLHATGLTNVDTAQQAAEALKPVAGALAFLVFALGIIGTGFLAVPVLAGSAAYAVGEAMRWPVGLARQPKEARAFYITLIVATLVGTAINFLPVDPIRALFWSAVINGVMVAPIIAFMMLLASSRRVMGDFTLSLPLKVLGWVTVVVMAFCVVGLLATMVM